MITHPSRTLKRAVRNHTGKVEIQSPLPPIAGRFAVLDSFGNRLHEGWCRDLSQRAEQVPRGKWSHLMASGAALIWFTSNETSGAVAALHDHSFVAE